MAKKYHGIVSQNHKNNTKVTSNRKYHETLYHTNASIEISKEK